MAAQASGPRTPATSWSALRPRPSSCGLLRTRRCLAGQGPSGAQTATSSRAVPGTGQRAGRLPPKRRLSGPCRDGSFLVSPGGPRPRRPGPLVRVLLGAGSPGSSWPGGRGSSRVRPRAPKGQRGSPGLRPRSSGAQGPHAAAHPGQGRWRRLGEATRSTVRYSPRASWPALGAGRAEKGRLLRAGLCSLTLRPGDGDREGSGPRGQRKGRGRGAGGGRTERLARSPAGAAAVSERSSRTAEPRRPAPRAGRYPSTAEPPPRVSARRLAEPQPRESRLGPGRLRSLSPFSSHRPRPAMPLQLPAR